MATDDVSTLALFATDDGEVSEAPAFLAIGRSGREERDTLPDEVSKAPYGTDFFLLPDRCAVGRTKTTGAIEMIQSRKGSRKLAAALIPPPGYTRTLLPAFRRKGAGEFLPFFAYAMGGFREDDFIIAAIKTEDNFRWDPSQYNGPDLDRKIKKKLKRHPRNRLLRHLARCATEYQCYNAQNIIYERWEGGIPVSPACNSACTGCISARRDRPPFSPQGRISFVPTAEEIVELGALHLASGQAILSFGQGCEGEPTLQGELLEKAIRMLRSSTDRGTININTNGSRPGTVRKLIDAGLDSLRVSLNSALASSYDAYYNPGSYTFQDVRETVRMAVDSGIFCSLNLLVMPGVNDSEQEREALHSLVESLKPSMIQFRNLNIDPDLFFARMPPPAGAPSGIAAMIRELHEKFPALKTGNFSPPLKE